jgi:hypothetical protein
VVDEKREHQVYVFGRDGRTPQRGARWSCFGCCFMKRYCYDVGFWRYVGVRPSPTAEYVVGRKWFCSRWCYSDFMIIVDDMRKNGDDTYKLK